MDKERQKKRKFNNSPSPPSSMEGTSFPETAGEWEDALSEDELLEKEVLRIKSSFLRWIELPFKDPKELSAGHPPPSASSYLPPLHTIRPVISKCSTQLLIMRHHILQIEESRLRGEPVDKLQQEVLGMKSRVVRRIQVLFKETVQGDLNPPPPISYFPPADVSLPCISRCFGQLLSIKRCIVLMEEESLSQSESGDELQQEIHDYEAEDVDDEADDEDMEVDDEAASSPDSLGQLNLEVFSWSSMNGNEETEGRYLCVSNGFEIWCLDLKQSSSSISPGPLPKIASLNLLGDQLPASVGLFKLGSDAYVIGGQQLPGSMKGLPRCIRWMFHQGKNAPKAMNIYYTLCYDRGVKGSSCDTYRLSMSAVDGTLCYTVAGDIEELRKPKVWPIAEKVGGKLNVVESVPFDLKIRDPPISYSHEVRDPDSGGWKEIPTIEEMDQIRSHVVVGDRIFAVTCDEGSKHHYLVFNSRTEKWKGRRKVERLGPLEVSRVWDIISCGIGRCAGEFHHGGGGESLYVLVTIMRDFRDRDPWRDTIAVAYLVTSMGKVVCYQRLRDFFKAGFRPDEMIAGTMIHAVDDEPWGTMCSVVSGRLKEDVSVVIKDHLFVNTFSVEVLPDAALKVEQLLVKGIEEDGPLVELEFVRLTSKDRHIFQTDAIIGEGEQFVGWRACFLTPV